ncbi:MAG TPA: hypothetical protein VMV14_00690 [Acidimicrobiales bacterium]|nr:hypothetical protein [Acidimicrobiales bacterium]
MTRRLALCFRRRDEGGQALAAVAALVGILILVPTGAQLLAVGQLPISQQAVFGQEALQAAHAGLSDYIDHLETLTDYVQYCSSGAFSCGTHTRDATTPNPAFATSANDTHWGYLSGTSTTLNVAYQYLVNTSPFVSAPAGPVQFVVDVTGRAGTSVRYVYQTLQATLLYLPGTSPTYAPTQVAPTSCAAGQQQIPEPEGATYAYVTAYGAAGGGTSSSAPGGGGNGAIETAFIPLSPASVPYLTASPGFAGASGTFKLLNIFGAGGTGGCGGTGGGNGGGSGASAFSQLGAGGGGATVLCQGTSAQCSSPPGLCASAASTGCIAVAAGGGGGTGGAFGGTGGYWNNDGTWTKNGQDGSNVLGLGSAAGGTYGGSSSTSGASGGGSFIGLLNGLGGGGGGGYPTGGGGGAAGGILNFVAGTGGGGGLGKSSAMTQPTGCSAAATNPATSYPNASDNGVLTISFYSGPACSGSPLGNVTSLVQVTELSPLSLGY